MTSLIHFVEGADVAGWQSLCGLPYYGGLHIYFMREWMTKEVENTTCKNCFKVLAHRAGLTKNTPAGIVSDKLKEMKRE